ncbi:UNVERIFIED_CONTAM: hypothetical protein NCL1_15789 [Trichonephila clavipes]
MARVVLVLMTLMIHRVDGLKHVKFFEIHSPPVGVNLERGSQFRCCPRHLTKVQNYEFDILTGRVCEY